MFLSIKMKIKFNKTWSSLKTKQSQLFSCLLLINKCMIETTTTTTTQGQSVWYLSQLCSVSNNFKTSFHSLNKWSTSLSPCHSQAAVGDQFVGQTESATPNSLLTYSFLRAGKLPCVCRAGNKLIITTFTELLCFFKGFSIWMGESNWLRDEHDRTSVTHQYSQSLCTFVLQQNTWHNCVVQPECAASRFNSTWKFIYRNMSKLLSSL